MSGVWSTWVKILRVCHLQLGKRRWSAATVWTALRSQNRTYKPCPHTLQTANLLGVWNVTDTLTQEYILKYTHSAVRHFYISPSQPLRNTFVIGSIIYWTSMTNSLADRVVWWQRCGWAGEKPKVCLYHLSFRGKNKAIWRWRSRIAGLIECVLGKWGTTSAT
jgi:hypothetical protein